MVKFLLKHEKIHEHIEHVIGKLPCDTLARHELVKLLVNLTSDMLWDMLGFFIFKLTSSNFKKYLLTEKQFLTSVTEGQHCTRPPSLNSCLLRDQVLEFIHWSDWAL